jgi:hypothetical protein
MAARPAASLMCCWWTHRSVISRARSSHCGTGPSLAQLTLAGPCRSTVA